MTILIDTQVLVWLINGDKKLGKKARVALEAVDNRLCVSYFSLFEITLKASTGKLKIDPRYVDSLAQIGIDILYPKIQELKQYMIFNENNKDPFDNILIATAKTYGYGLMTGDGRILELVQPDISILTALE